jgi:hypothetical protein
VLLAILLRVEVLFLAVCNMIRHVVEVDSAGSRGRRGDSAGVVVENGEISESQGRPGLEALAWAWLAAAWA